MARKGWTMAEAETGEMVFTSWRALRRQLLDDLANPSFRRIGQYTVNAAGTGGSFSVSNRSLADVRAMLELCDEMIEREERSYLRLTYPRNMGRG